MNVMEQYIAETGKDPWKIKNYNFTDEYVKYVKNYCKISDSPAAKVMRSFANKLKKMNQTKVKIEYFKSWGSNKHYDSIEYESEIPCFDGVKLKEEAAEKMKQFASEFHYTVEVESLEKDNHAWNKFIVVSDNSISKKAQLELLKKIIHAANAGYGTVSSAELEAHYNKLLK